MNGVDAGGLSRVYRVEWLNGDDALSTRLRGDTALVEEQFAKAHDVGVGDAYRIETRPAAQRGSA